MKNSPLADRHINLSAKMADFGGWLMPIEYPGGGVLAEHAAVRERVGIFDVSHLGKVSVKGKGALQFLNSVFTNDLDRITDGQAQYTLHCNSDGGVIDDLIVYRNSSTDLFLIPNASNTSDVVADLLSRKPAEIEIVNLHESFGVIAVQGPRSREVIKSFGINPEMDYMAFEHVQIAGCQVILCRTGYTGEHGYEIVPNWNEATTVWDALTEAIKQFDGLVCGLGARDTLRTEMGYPLHGHELSLSISPVQAAATWAIGWDKEIFSGSQALRDEKASGTHPRIRALVSQDRGIPRAGMKVKNSSGELVGEITSGTFSPTLKKGIALALLSHNVKLGDHLVIDVRGRDCIAEVTKLPLVASHVR
ncbi:MAG: glycine cleavage system aminomethyltransferase GcvT [Actinobacteria bacterium]|uniref:aminomethyltransferase n=1 Tax=freshwater metagenome TaxID=449393 RepID=A0A6J6EZK6_9ZZZZ|nr:glycine cleavage system aminomethyltransferase GcvT [Actinomycetota bacterium]